MCCSTEQELLSDYVGLALLSCLPAIPRDILTGMASWPRWTWNQHCQHQLCKLTWYICPADSEQHSRVSFSLSVKALERKGNRNHTKY